MKGKERKRIKQLAERYMKIPDDDMHWTDHDHEAVNAWNDACIGPGIVLSLIDDVENSDKARFNNIEGWERNLKKVEDVVEILNETCDDYAPDPPPILVAELIERLRDALK